MIDQDRMTELNGEIGAEDLALVVNVYLEEASAALDRIGRGLGRDDHARMIHFLRSGALNIGLAGFAELASGIRPDEATGADRLREGLERTRAALASRPQ